jgi:hypothetical protein
MTSSIPTISPTVPRRPDRFATLCIALLLGGLTHAASAAEPAPKDAAMEAVLAAVRPEAPKATVTPVHSSNIHLGTWKIPNPLPNYSLYCVILRDEEIRAPIREFVAVSKGGGITRRFDAKQFGALVAAAGRSQWKDADYLDAAALYVHLTSSANQDGWKLLAKPEDFTAITFNMAAVGPGVERQKEASRQIVAPTIASTKAGTVVTFYSWHNIGGVLQRWQITFGDQVRAENKSLGQFGGGGYD